MDYTPQDAGNSTHQVGDKYYKSEEVLLDLQSEQKDEDQIPY